MNTAEISDASYHHSQVERVELAERCRCGLAHLCRVFLSLAGNGVERPQAEILYAIAGATTYCPVCRFLHPIMTDRTALT